MADCHRSNLSIRSLGGSKKIDKPFFDFFCGTFCLEVLTYASFFFFGVFGAFSDDASADSRKERANKLNFIATMYSSSEKNSGHLGGSSFEKSRKLQTCLPLHILKPRTRMSSNQCFGLMDLQKNYTFMFMSKLVVTKPFYFHKRGKMGPPSLW